MSGRLRCLALGLLGLGMAGCGDDSASGGSMSNVDVPGLAGTSGGAPPVGAGVGSVAGTTGGTGVGTAGTAGLDTAGSGLQGGTGGAIDTAGTPAVTGGSMATGGAMATTGGTMATTGGTGGGDPGNLEPFSFFVTSLEIMRELSGSQDGFGGDFRFGQADGLSGADAICQEAASRVGFGAKTWRAFLSATNGGDGNPVHAIDRVGEGPWYDRNGRLIAENKAGLLQDRPAGDAATINDLPNEFGEGLMAMGDTHDVLTGTNAQGQLDSTDPANTCNDWTSTTAMPTGGGFGFPGGGGGGGLRVGHAWPAVSGTNWMAVHSETSCAPGVNLMQNGPGDGSSVGAGGGWGGIYCFALTP